MSDVFTEKQIKDFLSEINDDDLKMMFGFSIPATITFRFTREEIEEKLLDYWDYDVSVSIGDIIEIDEKTYTVTCVYTDNSVDLLSEDAMKTNKGLYNKVFKKVGKLQCITV